MTALQYNFFLCIIIAAIIYAMPLSKDKKKKTFLWVSIIPLIIVHTFFNYQDFQDLPNYARTFANCLKDIPNYLGWFYEHGNARIEMGFYLYNIIIRSITNNFHVFLMVTSIIMISLYYKTIYKFSPYVVISVLLYLTITFNQSLFVLRQHLAIAILLLSYPYIVEKDLKKYLIVILSASLVHASSLIFLPVYFLYWIRGREKYFISLAVMTAVVIFASSIIEGLIASNVEKYSSYLENELKAFSIKGLIMLFFLILYIYFLRGEIFSNGLNKLILTISIIGVVGNLVLGTGGNVGGRMLTSYFVILILQIPVIAKYIKPRYIRIVFMVITIIVFFLWGYYLAGDTKYWLDYKLML